MAVSRAHWVHDTETDVCSFPGCMVAMKGSRLTRSGSRHHCRRCGQLFCHEHAKWQMPLDVNAQPVLRNETPNVYVVRVCDVCYEDFASASATLATSTSASPTTSISRYTSHTEEEEQPTNCELTCRDRTPTFMRHRSRCVHDRHIASTAAARAIVDSFIKLRPPRQSGLRSRSLVPWELGPRCKFCSADFTVLRGRHHCRLCGSSGCGSCAPKRACAGGRLRICHQCSRVLAAWRVGESLSSKHGGALAQRPLRASQKREIHGSLQERFDTMLATKEALLASLRTFDGKTRPPTERPTSR